MKKSLVIAKILYNFYSIIPYYINDIFYYFYVIYLDKSDNKVKYFKGEYHFGPNILKFYNTEILDFTSNTTYLFNIDCNLINYGEYESIICFYGDEYNYNWRIIDISSTIDIYEYTFQVEPFNGRYIFKSLVLPGNEKVILCSYSLIEIFDCALYDSYTNQFHYYTKIGIVYDDYEAFNIILEYIEETKEIVIGKSNNNNEISLKKCSLKFECSDIYNASLTGIDNIDGANIIYNSTENKYYVIITQYSNLDRLKIALDMPVELSCKHYYNYNKTSCLSYLPKGYYCNSTEDKTIEKCYLNCSTCDKISYDLNKCITCNNEEEYYSLYNETNQYITCYYKDTRFDGLYLNLINKTFEPCSQGCKTCSGFNKCQACDVESNFSH